MARHNYPKNGRRTTVADRYDTDYVSLPEYPQYCSVVAVPLKTIFYNMDAAPGADDFYVTRCESDPVFKKLAKRIGCEVIA